MKTLIKNSIENGIEKVESKIKKFINQKNLTVASILSTILFFVSYYFFQEFLAINAGIMFAFTIVSIVCFLDTFVIGLNTLEQIEKGNVAYGLVFLSITIGVCFGFFVSFSVFLK